MNDASHLDVVIAERIAGRFACNQCDRKYRIRDITTIEKWEQHWLMRLVCAWCGAQELLSVALKGNRARAILLDLTPEEWHSFRKRPVITADDVIDMARAMRDYQGDFSEILEDALPDGD